MGEGSKRKGRKKNYYVEKYLMEEVNNIYDQVSSISDGSARGGAESSVKEEDGEKDKSDKTKLIKTLSVFQKCFYIYLKVFSNKI